VVLHHEDAIVGDVHGSPGHSHGTSSSISSNPLGGGGGSSSSSSGTSGVSGTRRSGVVRSAPAPIHALGKAATPSLGSVETSGGQPVRHHVTAGSGPGVGCIRAEKAQVKYKGIMDAARQIMAEEGFIGFFRGMGPRLLVHTPSVAISWTTYETVKRFMADRFSHHP